MPGGVFISYRREDSGGFAGRIYDRLTRSLGAENVFFDVDSIAPGVDFVDTLNDRLSRCDALVAVIGRSWLSLADASNHRRLDDPNDYVRLEIEAALQRGIRVIPVLVDGATLPKSGDLPPTLAKLTRRQAIEISLARFESDVERLVDAVSALEDELRRAAVAPAAGDNPGYGGIRPDASARLSAQAQGANPGASRSPGSGSRQTLFAPAPSSDGKRWGFAIPLAAAAAAIAVAAAAWLYVQFGLHDIVAHPWSPSFNCRAASAKTEFVICNNEQLSQLDNEVGVLYSTVRKSTDGDDRRQLDAAESVWVVERNTCENDFNCIKKLYDNRIGELKTKMSAKP